MADKASELQIDFQHNYALLLSYGDLSRESGMYSLLLIFFLMLAVIASASIATLGAVFQVSAARRERDFALFLSIGADGSQIKNTVLLESALYVVFAIPAGYLLGILFFGISRNRIDAVLYSAEKFPPIERGGVPSFFGCLDNMRGMYYFALRSDACCEGREYQPYGNFAGDA